MATTPAAAQTNSMTPAQANSLATNIMLSGGLAMLQPIAGGSSTVNPAQNPQLQISIPGVGFARGVWVEVLATVSNTDGALTATLTDFGPANVLSQVILRDLMSYERINIPGWQLAMLNSVKGRRPFGTALVKSTGIDDPINFGSNFGVISAPATIAHGATGTVHMWYYVPISYSQKDLRGGIYAATTSASIRLVLNINPAAQAFVAAATDTTQAVYGGTASCAMTSVTVNTYYDYIDQIPVANNGQPILPTLSMGTMYEIKNTFVQQGIPQGADFQIQIPNQRSFLSFIILFNHDGTIASGRSSGADVNYIARRTANITDIFHVSPSLAALMWRTQFQCDPPPGFYYFESREQPVSTRQFGNQSMILNASQAGANAYVQFGWESFAPLASVGQAQSLTAM